MEITKEYLAQLFEAAVKEKMDALARLNSAIGAINAIQLVQKRLAEVEEVKGE